MNKLIFFTAALFLTGPSVFSQHGLTSRNNMMRSGDKIVKQQVEYKDPGRAGENVLWDFGRLASVNDQYTLSYLETRTGELAGLEHGTLYYYSLSNDSLLLSGYKNPTTQVRNDLPELLLTFPFAYGDRHETRFYGRGLYSDRMEILLQGTVLSEADACGMMMLPSGDTLRNILRTRTLKYISEGMQPVTAAYYSLRDSVPLISADSIDYRLRSDSVVYAVETFRWYARGYRYPVFETVRSWTRQLDGSETPRFGTAFFYPPQEHYYLEEDENNLAVLDSLNMEQQEGNPNVNPWEGLTYNLYPNPVVTTLDVEMYLPRTANDIRVQLSDRQGRMLMEEDWGTKPEGIFTKQLYMGQYPLGEYILNIWLDGYKVSEKLLKR